jgi:hypothetical protein
MQTETLIYIILAGIVALLLAVFQYFNKSKSMSKKNMLFAFLRFISLFAVFLVLINPTFDQIKLSIEKPNLVIAIDNSSSISYLKQDTNALNIVDDIQNNKALQEKFNLNFYSFGKEIKPLDSFSFSEKQTNISQAFKQLSQIYKNRTSPTVLITDGNQTYGNDYQNNTNGYNQPIYTVILGDTISYTDLKIQQLNVNRYAFLKNKFPVEVILVYNGNTNVSSRFLVTRDNKTVYSKVIDFSKNNNSTTLNFTLPANRVGIGNYKASIVPLEKEKNKINNIKNFAIEVVNQKTKIAIVSDILHPDLGMLKKSIESNEQRFVSFVDPIGVVSQINDFQLIILYQPNLKFKSLIDKIHSENKNSFSIIGSKTDLRFLNKVSENCNFEITDQFEDYQAELNSNYAPFLLEDINFESFPPLLSNYGEVKINGSYQILLYKNVDGISTNAPLLTTFEINSRREALLLGENIWKWRAQSYLNTKSFNYFDDFIGRLIQYLASSKPKSRLNVDYQTFYIGNSNVIIKAEFFDKNYVFDTREALNIIITDKITKQQKTFPLILKNNNYQVDLSSLGASEYSFIVSATHENISKSGSFQILEYNVEQQFLNADVTKLEHLATNSEGSSYFISNASRLITDLLNDNRYQPIQKSTKNSIPLIDWKYLLGIIAFCLSLEWFLRKYNGLI